MNDTTNIGWLQSIRNALYNAYTGIVNFVKNPFENLTSYFKGNSNPDKNELDNIRNQHFKAISDENSKPKPNYVQLAKDITQDTKKYINNLIEQEIKKLGNPPCDFSVITLGSMARKESGPVTDLEIGFLIKEKSVKNYQYFYQLSQNLSDRLFLLGEHPDIGGKGLRMDEADNAPPHLRFFARNATKEQAQQLLNEAVMNREWDKIPYEGSRPFLATAEEFASYSQANFTQDKQQLAKTRREQYDIELNKALKDPINAKKAKTAEGRKQIENEVHFWVNQLYRPFSARELRTANDAGKKLGRNMDLLYGDKTLYKRFINKRESYFKQKQANGKSIRQNLAKDKMADDIREAIAKGKSPFVTGKLGKTLDIKRELYRFVEQFVTNLGFYHHCRNQNTFDLVKELKDKRVLSPQLAETLSDFIQFTSGLRLKEQSVLKRQGYAAYFDQDQFDEDKNDLEKEINQLKASVDYAEKAKQAPEIIAAKKRDLVKLENDYHHLLEMAPGKILNPADIQSLEQKYLPMGQEIFKAAIDWTQGKEHLGFKPVPTQFTPAMKNALDYVQHHPKGFFPALAQLKSQQKDLSKPQLTAFVKQCEKEKLITPEDFVKINALKKAACAA